MAELATVLIIDQNAERRFVVKQAVRQAGFTVVGEAGFGAAAVSLARESMPGVVMCAIDGLANQSVQTARSLIEILPGTPLIAYSADSSLELARQAIRVGARDFLTLPLKAVDVKSSITATLESDERRQTRSEDEDEGAARPSGLVVSVFGPKGGIGKSTITANLGASIGATGQHVACIDADTGFGDIVSMLNLTPVSSLTDVVSGLDSLTRETLPRFFTQHESGLMVIPAPPTPFDWKRISPEAFRRVVDLVANSFDIVLIDTSGTLDDLSLAALQASGLVLWVTTTDYSSIRDSKNALALLEGMGFPMDRIRLVVNETSRDGDVRSETIAETLGREIFWRLPCDTRLRRSAQVGLSVVELEPSSKIAKEFGNLARALTGAAPPARESRSRKFPFRLGHKSDDEPAITSALEGE
jgi:pilus assembly protein CpaE